MSEKEIRETVEQGEDDSLERLSDEDLEDVSGGWSGDDDGDSAG